MIAPASVSPVVRRTADRDRTLEGLAPTPGANVLRAEDGVEIKFFGRYDRGPLSLGEPTFVDTGVNDEVAPKPVILAAAISARRPAPFSR